MNWQFINSPKTILFLSAPHFLAKGQNVENQNVKSQKEHQKSDFTYGVKKVQNVKSLTFCDFWRSFRRSDFWCSEKTSDILIFLTFDVLIILKLLLTFWPFDVLIFDVPTPSRIFPFHFESGKSHLAIIAFRRFGVTTWWQLDYIVWIEGKGKERTLILMTWLARARTKKSIISETCFIMHRNLCLSVCLSVSLLPANVFLRLLLCLLSYIFVCLSVCLSFCCLGTCMWFGCLFFICW